MRLRLLSEANTQTRRIRKTFLLALAVFSVAVLALASSAPRAFAAPPPQPLFSTYTAWSDQGVIYTASVGSAYYPSVIYDANGFGAGTPKYAMWYSDGDGSVFLVTSTNGVSWGSPTTMVGLVSASHVQVLYDANCFGTVPCNAATPKYRMWFWHMTANVYDISSIETAESVDGIDWSNTQVPLTQNASAKLVYDDGVSWNRGTYGPVNVFYQPNASNTGTKPWNYTYVMYYDGTDGSHEDTGLAYSADGLYWNAYTANRVLSGSPTGAWDCYSSVYGTVYVDSTGFHYFYSGKGRDDGNGNCITTSSGNFDGIGYASSTDGEAWVKGPSPIFTTSDEVSYRSGRIYTPSVINDGSGILRMYFSVTDSSDTPKKIAYATLKSDNADLTGLSLSSGSLSPAFDSSTTAYTASVDNSVTDVTASGSTNPGANAVVTGGSSLSVGANTVNITVTAADGTTTKTYTVTVNRAAPAPTPTVVPSPVVCTINGVGETAVPPNYDLVGGLCVQKTPVPDASEPTPAAPDSSGTVDASVQSPAGTTVTVTTTWDPGTFTVPVTVTVTPQVAAPVPGGTTPPPPTPVAGGFTIGSTTVQLTVTDASGAKVTSFQAPIVIHISASQPGDVPAYSQDGTSWITIPQLSGPNLPAGQPDGYFVNADGSVDIYTRHATLFGLLKDTQAPTAPTLKAQVSGNKLYLLLKGAKDNVRVAGYQVLFNGHQLKTTMHGYLVLPARAGRFQVTATDTAGNKSKPSAAAKVVRHKRGLNIVKS